MLHKNIGLSENHKIHNWEYTNQAARTSASGLSSSDIGKVAWQKDNDTYWVLKTASPLVWVSLGKDGSALTSLDFDTATTATGAVGRLKWNDSDGTLEVGLKGGQSTLQIGQEVVRRIYNNTGSTLTDGQVVYLTGASAGRPTVALADADLEATSAKTFGIVTEVITNGSEGFVTTFGYVRGLNTSAFNEGDMLYLSGTAGQYTNIEPVPPQHRVSVGLVVRKNAVDGSIFVSINNGYEIDELHDVLISNPVDGQVLVFDGVSKLWKNVTASGFTPSNVIATRLVTANYTVVQQDCTIRVNATSGNVVVQLPAASSVTGYYFIIKKIDNTTNSVTINPNSTELIDGSTSASIYVYNQSLTIQSNGTSWDII